MRLLSILLTALLCASSLFAQKPLSTPLTFVEADSVVVWGENYADLRGVALVNADVTPVQRSSASTAEGSKVNSKSAFKSLRKAWNKRWLPAFTLHGVTTKSGDSPALTASQALDAASALFLLTGDGTLMDAAERLLYNDLLRMTLAPGGGSYEKHTAAQALMSSAGLMYATDADGIWVNLYANSTTHVKTPRFDVVVDQLTGMPFTPRVKVRLSAMPRNGYPLTLRLRLPAWATGSIFPASKYEVDSRTSVKTPTVYVNGHELLTTQIENGYVVISRSWNRGDEVLIDFPLRPLYVNERSTSANSTQLVRGPLLYTLTADSAPNLQAISPDSLSLEVGVGDTPVFNCKNFTAIPYFLKDFPNETKQ